MRFVRLSVLTATAALVAAMSGAAWAAPPVELGSQSQRVSGPNLLDEIRFAGITTHVYFEETLAATGDLEGTSAAQFSCVFVGTQSLVCHGEQEFTGTIEGADGPGTTTNKVRFTCALSTGECTGSATIIDATGGLAGVRGHATFTADLATGHGAVVHRLIIP